MTVEAASARARRRSAWSVWSAAVAVYMLSVFHRTSLSVAGILAAQHFHISASQLSTFIVLQLLVYAGMQVPVGALLDRFGSRRMMATGLVLLSTGQLCFAFASAYGVGLLARGIVGLGDSMCYVSVLRIVAIWFKPGRIPLVTQMTGLLGNVGATIAAIPMSRLLMEFGWRSSFAIVGLVSILFGIALYVFVIDAPAETIKTHHPDTIGDIVANVRAAWAEPGTQLGMWTHFTTMFSGNVMALLWGFPFLVKAEALSPHLASTFLTMMILVSIATAPLIGWLVGHYPRRRTALVLAIVSAIILSWTAVLACPNGAPFWLLALTFAIVGTGGPASAIGFDFARTFNPNARFGTASGIVNIGGFAASLVTILAIGIVLGALTPGTSTDYTRSSFVWAMSTQYIVWAIGLRQIWRCRRRTNGIRMPKHRASELHPAEGRS